VPAPELCVCDFMLCTLSPCCGFVIGRIPQAQAEHAQTRCGVPRMPARARGMPGCPSAAGQTAAWRSSASG
jgi:hypothetical protein